MAYRDQETVLDYAQEQAQQGKQCVVCVWGDLNVSAKELLNRVRRRAETVELVPGVSSIQFACARAGISLEESLFLTLHQRWDRGSELGELVETLNHGRRNVILLPRPFDFMPPAIAANAITDGANPDHPVTVFQRLTLPDEQRWGWHAGWSRPGQRRIQRSFHHGLSPHGGGAGLIHDHRYTGRDRFHRTGHHRRYRHPHR